MMQRPKAPGLGNRAPAVTVFRQENSTVTEQIPASRQDLSPMVWAAFASAVWREHQSLPLDHPRRKPTLPRLRFMQDPHGGRP
jgi:hypothetical protein